MTTKNETGDAVTIWLFSDFLFHLFFFLYVEEFSFLSFYFFLFIAILIFFYQWWQTNKMPYLQKNRNDVEQMINYEWR